MRHRASGPFILAQAVLFAGFSSYLSTSEVIYAEVFGREDLFPILYGGMALLMGLASLANSRIVERIGLERMVGLDLAGYLVGAVALVLLALTNAGRPPLPAYLLVLALLLANHAVLIPNLNARAMEPVGDIAGTASAINGSVLIGLGALIGSMFDRAYDGTVLPLSSALLGTGLVAALLVRRGADGVSGTAGPSLGRRSDRRPGGRSAVRPDPS